MNLGIKDIVLGGISIIITIIMIENIGGYDSRLEETILMSFMFFVIVIMIILEGIYELIKWTYRRINKEK